MDHDARWDAFATKRALREAGVTPRLHPDGTRLVLQKGQASLLTEEIRDALRANHDELLRDELARTEMGLLQDRLDQAGIEADSAEGYAVHGATLETERFDNVWKDGDLETFKEILKATFSPGHEVLDTILSTRTPAREAARPADHEGEPVLFEEPPRTQGWRGAG